MLGLTNAPETDAAREAQFVNYRTGEDARTDEERMAAVEQARIDIIQRLGADLLKLRAEAISARANTGIEQDWQEDEEFYQSIDSANPDGETNVSKPVSSEGGPVGRPQASLAANRSSVFVPVTRPYVDAAHAKIADMLLPTDDWPFKIRCTNITTQDNLQRQIGGGLRPIAEAAGMMAGAPPAGPAPADMAAQPIGPNAMQQAQAMAQAGGQPQQPQLMGAVQPGMPPQATSTSTEPSATEKTRDEIACEKAEKRIQDWLTECQFHGEYRKMLENAAKLGTGVLKGPIQFLRKSQAMKEGPDGRPMLIEVEEIVPISVSISPWNFFPDPHCGEDVQKGSYVWEYDSLSQRTVQALRDDDTYILAQLEKVIEEGARKGSSNNGTRPANSPQAQASEKSLTGGNFDMWYFHGLVAREALIAAGIPAEDLPEDMPSVMAVVTMMNDTVVKCALSATDTGGFPYDVMPWQRRAGMVWGMGVARQMRTAQRVINGTMRAMMDNAAFTSGPMVGIREKWIKPLGGDRSIKPRQLFLMNDNAPDTAKIGDAISVTNIDSNQVQMEQLLQIGMKMAEDATGLPMLLQGQQGNAPDTVGGMTILNNNGSTVLRRIARQSDDFVMERHIRRYYTWLLENTDYDDEKGDFQIDCNASTALVDREMGNQALVQMYPLLVQDPDINKTKLTQEMLKANRFDPKRIYMTDAEKRARDANPPPQPPVPQVEVAKIREAGANERLDKQLAHDSQQTDKDMQLEIARLEKEWNEVLANIASGRESLTDSLKEKLFATTAKISLQRELAHKKMVGEALKPPVEPAGRAPAGKAYAE